MTPKVKKSIFFRTGIITFFKTERKYIPFGRNSKIYRMFYLIEYELLTFFNFDL